MLQQRIRKAMQDKDGGFTLVELLVVMIIIGILSAIAVPVFLNQRNKAFDTAVKSDMKSVAQQLDTAYVDGQTYPTTATAFAAYNPKLSVGTVVQVYITNTSGAEKYILVGKGKSPNYFKLDTSLGSATDLVGATAPTGMGTLTYTCTGASTGTTCA